jgi:hypothetical protein
MRANNNKRVIAVCYEPRPHTASTLVILAINYRGRTCSLTHELPIEREKILNHYHAAMLVLAGIGASEGAYSIEV